MPPSFASIPPRATPHPSVSRTTAFDTLEQEQLLHAMDAGMTLADRQQLFQWARGPLQAVLPHEVLLCMQIDEGGRLARVLCLHQVLLDSVTLGSLTDALAPALAELWRMGSGAPVVVTAAADGLPAECAALLGANGHAHALVHGCLPAAGAATVFALLGMPLAPDARHAWRLQLLLPYLHLGLLRMPARGARPQAGSALARALSGRELAILDAVRTGRTNEEVARQLGISALTVKNHLQRIYRLLGVANRAHAVARCLSLKLL